MLVTEKDNICETIANFQMVNLSGNGQLIGRAVQCSRLDDQLILDNFFLVMPINVAWAVEDYEQKRHDKHCVQSGNSLPQVPFYGLMTTMKRTTVFDGN